MNSEKRLSQAQSDPFSLDSTRILIVDDSLDSRDLFTFIFEDYGAEVFAVASAQEALEIVEQMQPHLLISDIDLPGEDGYSLIRKVRRLEANQGGQIPAIAVTGVYREKLNYVNAIPTEFQLHLTKPVHPDELITAAVILIKQEIEGERELGDKGTGGQGDRGTGGHGDTETRRHGELRVES